MSTNKKYPFKFLDAYTKEDAEIFFGRTEEVDKLYEMVYQSDLILIYGTSGTGKSSLIQCGLASRFETHDWLALNIRRGSNLNSSFERALQDAGGDLEAPDNDLDWLDKDLTANVINSSPATKLSPLAKSLKAIYLKHYKPIYLIFDQFEELYVLGNKAEQNTFIETVKQVLRVEQPVKVILSIREEYLGYLYEFEGKVPELLRKKLRVEPMNLDKVKAVMIGINEFALSNVHLKKGEEEAIAETIFEKIKGEEKNLQIKLPYLQVFLDKLYLEITGDEDRKADATISMAALQQMGDLGDVLRNFLDDQVLKTARELQQKPETIWKILSPFVTLDGTKEPIDEAALSDRLPLLDKALIRSTLQAFVQSRILRYTENEQLYEIAHDSLAKQIHAKRSDEEIALLEVQRLIKSQISLKEEAREFFTEKQLLFMQPFLDKFRLNAEEQSWMDKSEGHLQSQKAAEEAAKAKKLAAARKRSRVLSALLGFAIIALVVAGVLGFIAQKQGKIAGQALEDAEKNLTLANENEKEATDNLALANINEQKATDNLTLAKKNEEEAKANAIKAEQEKQNAIATLANLQKANIKTVELLLGEIDRNILNLEYSAALEKTTAALGLGVKKEESTQRLQEIAYFYTESGQYGKADTALQAIGLGIKGDNREKLLNQIEQLDNEHFKFLEKRYYPEMLTVAGGTFYMGCDTTLNQRCQKNDETWHELEVSSFKIAKYETTVWQFALYCAASPGLDIKDFREPTWIDPGNNPVVNVSWLQAVEYANWVSKQENIDEAILKDSSSNYTVNLRSGYRLPTEAEWEYAAKGGNKPNRTIYSGSDSLDLVAWYSGNSNSRTHPVGRKNANALGLYDMSGNVWEWCWDWYGAYDKDNDNNPKGAETGDARVLRGGSWNVNFSFRVSSRDRDPPDYWYNDFGFRLARGL